MARLCVILVPFPPAPSSQPSAEELGHVPGPERSNSAEILGTGAIAPPSIRFFADFRGGVTCLFDTQLSDVARQPSSRCASGRTQGRRGQVTLTERLPNHGTGRVGFVSPASFNSGLCTVCSGGHRPPLPLRPRSPPACRRTSGTAAPAPLQSSPSPVRPGSGTGGPPAPSGFGRSPRSAGRRCTGNRGERT